MGFRTVETSASLPTGRRRWPAASLSDGTLARATRPEEAGLGHSAATGTRRQAAGERRASILAAIACIVPFGLAVLGYEAIRLAPRTASVHVVELVELEARLFSVPTAAGPRTLSDILASHPHPLLDLWCGATYLSWVLGVLVTTAYLFTRARSRALELSLGFLVVNLAGWAIWFLYPAAPPWYVDMYGTGPAVMHAGSSAAGLARLDSFLGVPLTSSLYAQSAYVFGAMPSLHVAYATLAAWVSFPVGGKLRAATLVFAASMAFSAVYFRHHYIIDVVAGVALAVPVAVLVQRIARRFSPIPGMRA